MSTISRSLCWAAAFLLLALANAIGWVSDGNAATMFAVIPALWVATTLGGRRLRKPAA